jgi:hypothetical protein
MSRLFEALSNVEAKRRSPDVVPLAAASPDVVPPVVTAVNAVRSEHTPNKANMLNEVLPKPVEILGSRSVPVKASPESHIVALTDPNSLGAEKFRALVTRLDYLRKKHEAEVLPSH